MFDSVYTCRSVRYPFHSVRRREPMFMHVLGTLRQRDERLFGWIQRTVTRLLLTAPARFDGLLHGGQFRGSLKYLIKDLAH